MAETTAPNADMVLPSRTDPVAREASTFLGGPVGRHARLGSAWWTPLRVLIILTVLTFGAGWVQKLPCHDGSYGAGNKYAYQRLCYTDVHALWYAEGLNEGKTPYADHPVEYPVVIGGLMGAAAKVSKTATQFFDVTSLLLLFCAIGVTVTSAILAGRRRIWDAALVALAPGLIIHGTTNWDLPAAALAGGGLVFWARRRPALAGLLLGLGTATKLYPAIFFVPLFFLCLRAKKLREWLIASAVGAGTFLALYAAAWPLANKFAFAEGDPERNSLMRFFVLNRERTADWDSLWFATQHIMGKLGKPNFFFSKSALNLGVMMCLAGGLGLLCLLIWKAPRRPRLGQTLFLAMGIFLLTNKVNSPQYTIWLIPLAVMARPRWGAFLAWQFLEVGVLFTRFYYFLKLGDGNSGVAVEWFLGAIFARDAALLVLMGLVVREMLKPEHDVVRASGEDDPAGGVLCDDSSAVLESSVRAVRKERATREQGSRGNQRQRPAKGGSHGARRGGPAPSKA